MNIRNALPHLHKDDGRYSVHNNFNLISQNDTFDTILKELRTAQYENYDKNNTIYYSKYTKQYKNYDKTFVC